MEKIRLGFALTGSFCTFDRALKQIESFVQKGYDVLPIMSFNAFKIDTRFGQAIDFINEIEKLTGKKVISTIEEAEPIGPKKLTDVLIVLPCTGNTLSKLTYGIYDTPVTMAVKSHLRNERPVVIGVSSNDSLSGSAKNIGSLLNVKHYYFVPMKQDNPHGKPFSVVCDFTLAEETVKSALIGKQLQPILL